MKSELRKRILEKRTNLSKKEILDKSQIIIDKLKSLSQYKNSKNIMYYSSFKGEVETVDLIKEALNNKNVFLPVLIDKEITISKIENYNLTVNRLGILEPINKDFCEIGEIELAIIPGIMFDKKGNRLGFGNGCYDRYLIKGNPLKIGLAFSFQLTSLLPKESHDIPVDIIITENEIIRCTDDN